MLLILSLLSISGCKSNTICEAGATQLCLCSSDAYGVQICDIDGDNWGGCDCTDKTQSSGSGAGSGEGSGAGSGEGSGEGSGAGSGEGSGAGSGAGSGEGSGSGSGAEDTGEDDEDTEDTGEDDFDGDDGSYEQQSIPKSLEPWDIKRNDGFNGWSIPSTSPQ